MSRIEHGLNQSRLRLCLQPDPTKGLRWQAQDHRSSLATALLAPRSKRYANADLGSSLRNNIRKHTKQTHAGEYQ